MKLFNFTGFVALALSLGFWGQTARADNPTAFDLAKMGDKYVGEQAKGKVVQIRSEKSMGSLMPDVWYVVYYDPTATMKTTEVKFNDGQMLEVKRPIRLLEPVTGGNRELETSKLKIDSDRALKIALHEPMLQKLDLRSAQYWLEGSDTGPVWKIKFWAPKINRPDELADIGQIVLSSDTGDILRNDLHINSVQ